MRAQTLEPLDHERVKHLSQVSLFQDLTAIPVALEKLALIMSDRAFAPGAPIIREGESGSDLYILISGQAAVYKSTPGGDHYKVAILGSAMRPFFGEGALLDSDARTATIKAETECHCLVLDRKAFEGFSREHPEWAMPVFLRIARAVMSRLSKSNSDLMLLYNALLAEVRGE